MLLTRFVVAVAAAASLASIEASARPGQSPERLPDFFASNSHNNGLRSDAPSAPFESVSLPSESDASPQWVTHEDVALDKKRKKINVKKVATRVASFAKPKPAFYHRKMLVSHAKAAGVKAGETVAELPLQTAAGLVGGATGAVSALRNAVTLRPVEAAAHTADALVRPVIGVASGATLSALHSTALGMNAVGTLYHGAQYVGAKCRDALCGKPSPEIQAKYRYKYETNSEKRRNHQMELIRSEKHLAKALAGLSPMPRP